MIDPVFAPFVTAAALTTAYYLVSNLRVHARNREAWRTAARACALRDVRVDRRIGFTASGRSGAFELSARTGGAAAPVVDLHVRLRPITDRVGVWMPGGAAAPDGPVTSQEDVLVGEPALDDRLLLTGERLAVHALFDADTRAVLREFVDRQRPGAAGPCVMHFRVSDGELIADAAVDRLPETLASMLELARRLADVPPLEARVAEIAARDPQAGVRLACLSALMEERPRHPSTRAALQAALRDSDDEVRLTAARTLRTEGRDALRALAGSASSEDHVSARAIEALGAHFPAADAQRTLEAALRAGRFETVGGCLDSLASRGADHLATVAQVLGGPSDSAAALAASALGLSGTSAAEPLLVRALAHPAPDVRASAVRSLARVGTATSIPDLRAVEGDPALRRLVREAVAAVRERLSGVGVGQLALSPEGGEVSLAEGAAGRVSLGGRS